MKMSIALAFTFAAVLVAPARVSASTVADCDLLIVALSEQTAATTFLRGDKGVKTELQLQHHLSATSKELGQLDLKAAVKEMGDFETNVNRAIGAEVLSAADGAALNASADGVISCIQQVVP